MSSLTTVRMLAAVAFCALSACRASEAAAAVPTIDVSTSIPVKGHNLPQLAFDGKAETCFWSKGAVKAGDDVTVRLPTGTVASSVTVRTGTPDHQGLLAHGTLETSSDGTAFSKAADFSDGSASVSVSAPTIRAFRIVVGQADGAPLAIAEIAIGGAGTLPPVRFFTRFEVDFHQAPEDQAFAESCKRLLDDWYPRLSDQFDTPEAQPQRSVVRILFDLDKGVAHATTGSDGISEIHVCKSYAAKHPDDTALIIHEVFHIVQGYNGVGGHGNLGWITEGLADYVRNRLFKPVVIRPDPDRSKYTDAYTTTAAFLMWIEDRKKKGVCFKLNAAMRIPDSPVLEIFKSETGQDIDSLWAEYTDSLRKG
jgi:hypothetical protein